MSVQPGQPPLIRRLSPGRWTGIVWVGAMFYACIDEFVILPGDRTRDDQLTAGLDLKVSWPILLGAAVLVLAACRLLERRPLVAYALLLIGSAFGASLLGQADEFPLVQILAPDVALYFIAAATNRRTSLYAAGMALVGLLIPLTVRLSQQGGTINTAGQLAVALTVLVAWLLGDSARQSRLHAEQVRAQAATQAVTDERLRIARELHDAVAHTMGIVALQAGAARRVIDTQPARAKEAIGEVENASRETLAGLRRMLGALRETDSGEASVWEAPGLDQLHRLAEATTAAGVRTILEWHGKRRPLPPDIDLSAYRIVQESVTNVVRHAGARECLVRIGYEEDELSLEVTDTGRGPAPGSDSGYGLVGMRERVALLHGDLSTGPRPGGGFRVAVRLPVPQSARRAQSTAAAS
ncbi:sensor histidine kinase [Streptomyces sp. NBC_01104]|uniref:sensor histidine kinase n=1 Tax=Streptomyces sp. NBC_01104 TaxID=2903750 RepID=UPI00386A23A3|nr:sensor histidine kinase [Streptomyces sp. NBC_01104]